MSSKVNTEFVNPPIYSRDFDWSATHDDYDEGDPIGWGRTEEKAIQALDAFKPFEEKT